MTLPEQLADHGIRARSYGQGSQKLTCPKCSHERRNKTETCLSLTIDDKGAVWHCHHCEWADGFVLKRDQGDWKKPERKREPVEQPQSTDLPADAIAWFAERGVSEDTLEFCDVTWSPQRRAIMFPYRWPKQREIVNAKFRRLPKEFGQIKGGDKIYWLLNYVAPENGEDVIIVEGEIDALSLIEAGIPNVISVPDGAPKHVKEGKIDPKEDVKFSYVNDTREVLEPFQRIILATDSDGPGEALAEELARRYGKDRCWRVRWPEGCKDANDVLIQHGKTALRECIRRAKPYPIEGVFTVEDYTAAILQLYHHGALKGTSTQLPSLDQLYTVVRGQFTVVTGIPNNGKSELIDQIMVNLALKEKWRFGVCSFENDPANHIIKWAEKLTGMPFGSGPTPRMSEDLLRQAIGLADEHFYLIRNEGEDAPTIDWILAKAKWLVERHGINGLVIDPYNEVEHKRPSNMSETEYVSFMLTKVKRFAQAHDVHVWFVAHPAKMRPAPGDTTIPAPSLYDISGSAHWVNKADNGLVVHRGEAPGTADVYVRKCRFKWVGRRGIATLAYDRVTGKYADMGKVEVE